MSRVPRIRFKGFEEDWEQRKLGEICQITMGQSPDGSTYSETPSDYILVQGNADLKDGWVYPRIWTTQKTKMADAGDLIMSVRAPAGTMGKTYYDVVIGRGVAGIKGSEFIYQTLVKMDSDGYWKILAAGSTFESINSDVVNGAEIMVTENIDEQNKIGDYLASIDHLITLHQRKLEKLKIIKKSMLENLFPQNEEKTPKIRFSGFTKDWEQRKLGEIGSVAMCRRVFKYQTTESGDIPFFKIGSFGATPDAFIPKDLFEKLKMKYPYPEKGDVLISASGSIGRTVVFTGKDEYFQDSNIVWLKHDNSIINHFLKYLYSIVKWVGIEGTTIKRLYNDNILKTEVIIPTLSEQQKVSNYLDGLDHLITLHQSKLDKLQKIKKSMLESMFV